MQHRSMIGLDNLGRGTMFEHGFGLDAALESKRNTARLFHLLTSEGVGRLRGSISRIESRQHLLPLRCSGAMH